MVQTAPYFKIYSLSEGAVTMEFGNEIGEEVLMRIRNFDRSLKENAFPGFYNSVPAYTTLSVFFDPLIVANSTELKGANCYEKVTDLLTKLAKNQLFVATSNFDKIIIPVCYGGAFGADLEEVAALHKLTQKQVISLHIKAIYKVYMIGFVPGFAYLGGMEAVLATPRKPTPRKAIPAGSVGIAGQQTGIYPLQTPGGWQIIGRTPLKMFDAKTEQPSLLKAGDQVVFRAIDMEEFDHLSH